MKIVLLDGRMENPGDLSWDALAGLGDLTIYDRTSLTDEDEIASRIADADILLTNKTPVSAYALERNPNVKYISVLATGYNIVDTAAARSRASPSATSPPMARRPWRSSR